MCLARTLGTPTNETWPGVEELPSFKASFPKWRGKPLSEVVPQLDPDGSDLFSKLLAYNPAYRISAKRALQCAYFQETMQTDV